jgi:hypothetical protein
MGFSLVLIHTAGASLPVGETPNYQPRHPPPASVAATGAQAPMQGARAIEPEQWKQLEATRSNLPRPAGATCRAGSPIVDRLAAGDIGVRAHRNRSRKKQ